MKSEFPSEINPNEPGHEVNEQTPEQFQQFNQPQDILMTEEIDQDRSQPVEINIAALSDLTGQIESLKIQLEERSTQYMRIAADFENYRKRTSKEKEEIDLQVKRNTITELLPVVDNFERARSHLKPQSEGEMTIHKSYQGVYKQLVDCLKRLGVAPEFA
jgi:molecular chaperone GrpE